MPKDIKIKEKDNYYIQKLEKKIAYTSRIKRSVSNQYDKLKQENDNKQNVENSNATNYATTKVMRTGDRSARETTYIITGISQSTYRKTKMKILEKKEEKNNKLENENISKLVKFSNIKKCQYDSLIKEKQNFKNIKAHSYKNNGVKTNSNTTKIKTGDNTKNTLNLSLNKNKIEVYTSNEVVKKLSSPNIKQNSIRIKNIAQKIGKVVTNIVTRRNKSADCIWKWNCFYNFIDYYANSRNV